MGLRNRFRDMLRRAIGWEDILLSDPRVVDLLGGTRTPSGQRVSVQSALTYSPLWSGVDILQTDVSRLPFRCYRRQTSGTVSTEAPTHRVARLLLGHTGEMTSNLWLSLMMAQAVLWGNGYSVIHRDPDGRPAWLEFLRREQVFSERLGGVLWHTVTRSYPESREDLPASEYVTDANMFCLRGLLYDRDNGLALIEYARNTIGRMLSAEGYTDDFFANDATPGGLLIAPTKVNAKVKEEWLRQMKGQHEGTGKRHRLGFVDGGLKYEQLGISPDDAMLVDLLNLGTKDVARFLKMPPHKLGDDAKVAYNSLGEENASYLNSTLSGWLSRLQHEANAKLFTMAEADEYYTEFDTRNLVRENRKTRLEANEVAIRSGQMTLDEARADENRPPVVSFGGTHFMQANIVPVGSQTKEPSRRDDDASDSEDSTPPQRTDKRWVHRDALQDVMDRCVTRVIRGVTAKVAKDPEARLEYVSRLDDLHREPIKRSLDVVLNLARHEYGIQATADDLTDQVLRIAGETIGGADSVTEQRLEQVLRPASRLLATNAIMGDS